MAAGRGRGDPGNVGEETVKVVMFCLPCLSNKMSFFYLLVYFFFICTFFFTLVSLLEGALPPSCFVFL